MSKKIGILIGSASATSYSELVVKHLAQIAPSDLKLNIIPIASLPLYDRDLDSLNISEYNLFRNEVQSSDAFIWVSPEHNGALSAMLKNAIDVGSRPMGKSAWIGKPLGIVTVSAGMAGGVVVADQIRNIASRPFVSMPTYHQSACVAGVFNGVFNEQGEMTNDLVKDLLARFINGYSDFIKRF